MDKHVRWSYGQWQAGKIENGSTSIYTQIYYLKFVHELPSI